MNNRWAFLPMVESNDLLSDPAALRARMDEDGYLYFREVLPTEKIRKLRHQILLTLWKLGWIHGGVKLNRGFAKCRPVHEALPDYAVGYDQVQRLQRLHALGHDKTLNNIMKKVVGPTAWHHPLAIARLGFPLNQEYSTPPHQDWPNNQGTHNLTATWIPIGDCPIDLGPVAVLRGSHKYGVLPLERHEGPGNRQAQVPLEMYEEHRWVTTDFTAGDVLLFGSHTVHAALHNASDFYLRLSVDFRFQQEGEELTPIVLEPHFQRQTWDDIYATWPNDRYTYYWRDKDYTVVPFEEIPVPPRDDYTPEELKRMGEIGERLDVRTASRDRRLADLEGLENSVS